MIVEKTTFVNWVIKKQLSTLQFQKQPATPVEGPLPMSHRVVDQKSEEKSKNTGFDDDDFDDFHNFDFSDFDANESK